MTHDERSRTGVSRREALKLGTAAAIGVGLVGPACKRLPPAAPGSEGNVASTTSGGAKARNVILMISDGMSAGTLSLCDPFARVVRGKDRGTHWLALMGRDGCANGLVETDSLSAIVTDSAAAASALGSGSRVNNGSINMLPDGSTLTPLATLVRDTGRRVGLVTTTTMTHATPAGFAAVQDHRNQQHEIATQYLDHVDVLLGGGREYFDGLNRPDGLDLIGQYMAAGYTFWDQRSSVLSAGPPSKVLGLFSRGQLPYTIDHRQSPQLQQSVPTLAEMTRAALGSLNQSSDSEGFFLMVEGGRVDHAAHNNDAAALLWDQLAFDDAVGQALAFIDGRDDTLLIVTSDHGNANPGLNGTGPGYAHSRGNFERLASFSASFDHILPALRAPEADAKAVIDAMTGLDIPTEHAQAVAAVIRGEASPALNRQHANAVGTLGQVLGNQISIQFTGLSHTQDYVNLSAVGPGCEALNGFTRNTDTFRVICDVLGITHVNATAQPETAEA